MLYIFHIGQDCVLIKARHLTLPMLRLRSSNAQERKDFWKPPKPCHVCTHWIALNEYSRMSTHMPGFQCFFRIFALFCICQLRTIRVNIFFSYFLFLFSFLILKEDFFPLLTTTTCTHRHIWSLSLYFSGKADGRKRTLLLLSPTNTNNT